MKNSRLLDLVLVVVIICSLILTGCDSQTSDMYYGGTFEEGEVLSGTGDKIGIYGCVHIKKAAFQSMSYDEIKSETERLAEIEDDLNWFSILFDDGTGISLTDSLSSEGGYMMAYSIYGEFSEEGDLEKTIGFVVDSDTYFMLVDNDEKPISQDTEPKGINGIT